MKNNIIAQASGDVHILLLTDSGKVFAVGDNSKGQLGVGIINKIPSDNQSSQPLHVKGLPAQINAIAAGDNHSLALSKNGEVFSWGGGDLYVNGEYIFPEQFMPDKVKGLKNIKAIAAIEYDSFALNDKGEVYNWCWNVDTTMSYYWRVGRAYVINPEKEIDLNGSAYLEAKAKARTPMPLEAPNDRIIQIAASGNTLLGLTEQGKVWLWDIYLEDERNRIRNISPKPRQLVGVRSPIIKIAAGVLHSLVLTAKGDVYAWGENGDGQLGLKKDVVRDLPKKVLRLPKNICNICGGLYGGVAQTKDNTFYEWGANYGLETKPNKYPVLLNSLDNDIVKCLFGPGGEIIDISFLENSYRKLLANEINL